MLDVLAGNDAVTAATLPAGIVKLTIDGGDGADNLIGSRGDDTILAGAGNDTVNGNQGNDTIFLGDGDDIVTWNPGDGNDIIEGDGGTDELLFNGSATNELFEMFANGTHFRLFRNVANVLMDTNAVERIQLNALGGADEIRVGDLTGTGVSLVQVNLAGGSGQPNDGAADKVVINGTNGDDIITVASANGEVTVAGLAAQVKFNNIDAGIDELHVNALGGADVVNASGLAANLVKFTVNGGLGNDAFIGSEGNDFFNGGDGNDTALMGAGNDTFVWNPGDDNDILEGQAGFDSMLFNGAAVSESIDISANGGRVRFFRNVASVVMDLDDVEGITFNALGGADIVVVNDLSGTDVVEINLDLNIFGGGGDIQPDTVVVVGTNGDDVILAVGDASGTSVLGLAAQVNILGGETGRDILSILALNGDDVVEGSGLAGTSLSLTADGGAGADVLIGGDLADVLSGGDGDDVLIGGLGLDVLDGGTGDNIVIQ